MRQFEHERNDAAIDDGRTAVVTGSASEIESRAPAHRRWWRSFHAGVLFGAIVAVAVTLLIIQNGHSARITWIAFHFRAPEWIVLFVTAAAGAVVWELARLALRRRNNHRHEALPQSR